MEPIRRARAVLAGVAIRPLAQSAARAGVRVVSVDRFGDRDHRRTVPNLSLRRDDPDGPGTLRRMVELAAAVEASEAAYGASFENHPGLVGRLARGRRLLGNPPAVLRAVRHPRRLREALRGAGLPALPVRLPGEAPPDGADEGRWIRKPLRGGGGRGVRPWRPGEAIGDGAYLQRRADGRPVAALFVADGARSRLLGLAEMLVGRRAFGADGFTYCGSVAAVGPGASGPGARLPEGGAGAAGAGGGATAASEVEARAAELAEALTRRFGLTGLNGVDAVLGEGTLWPLEVNPRVTASMELLERGGARSLFRAHRAACLGDLPDVPPAEGVGARDSPGPGAPASPAVLGKAVLRARRPGPAPDLERLDGLEAADVPEPGERVEAGAPLCTVFARAGSRDACLAALEAAAGRVYAAMREARRRPPTARDGGRGSAEPRGTDRLRPS